MYDGVLTRAHIDLPFDPTSKTVLSCLSWAVLQNPSAIALLFCHRLHHRNIFATRTNALTSEHLEMPFAQLVIGPPGSGKSTYCNVMQQFMSAIGRKCSVVNLDPANDHTSYPCALDVRDLVSLEEIMAEEELGPNGGVLYALEELENNIEWLEQGLGTLEGRKSDHVA